ncbi:MAG TPA: methyltransferase [Polyangiaceae bacterium]|nr:methyltransferase [Polyangiaceae bacterium]
MNRDIVVEFLKIAGGASHALTTRRRKLYMRRPSPARDSAGASDAAADAFFGGRLTLFQPRKGYRVNVDTLLLAEFAALARPKARCVVDLGAGVGALALAYAFLGSAERLELVEREAALAGLATRNLEGAGSLGTVSVADLAVDGLPASLRGVADVVLSNPPFYAEETGTVASAAKRGARNGTLGPFLVAAAAALGRRGYAFFVYPAPALPELLDAAGRAALVAKRLRFVHAFAASPARLALVELRRAKPRGLVVEPPLVEWTSKGVRSPALVELVGATTRRAIDEE